MLPLNRIIIISSYWYLCGSLYLIVIRNKELKLIHKLSYSGSTKSLDALNQQKAHPHIVPGQLRKAVLSSILHKADRSGSIAGDRSDFPRDVLAVAGSQWVGRCTSFQFFGHRNAWKIEKHLHIPRSSAIEKPYDYKHALLFHMQCTLYFKSCYVFCVNT